jgi:hypothetical protein
MTEYLVSKAIDAAIEAAPSWWKRGAAQKEWEREDFRKVVEAALSLVSPSRSGDVDGLSAALERLDEAKKGWETGERVDCDEAVCILRLGTVRPIEEAARAYATLPTRDEVIEEAAKIARDAARLHADMALEGLPEQARVREAMEAMATKIAVQIEQMGGR